MSLAGPPEPERAKQSRQSNMAASGATPRSKKTATAEATAKRRRSLEEYSDPPC